MTAAAACGEFAAGHPSGRKYQSIVHLQQMWRTAGVKCQSSTAHSSQQQRQAVTPSHLQLE